MSNSLSEKQSGGPSKRARRVLIDEEEDEGEAERESKTPDTQMKGKEERWREKQKEGEKVSELSRSLQEVSLGQPSKRQHLAQAENRAEANARVRVAASRRQDTSSLNF